MGEGCAMHTMATFARQNHRSLPAMSHHQFSRRHQPVTAGVFAGFATWVVLVVLTAGLVLGL